MAIAETGDEAFDSAMQQFADCADRFGPRSPETGVAHVTLMNILGRTDPHDAIEELRRDAQKLFGLLGPHDERTLYAFESLAHWASHNSHEHLASHAYGRLVDGWSVSLRPDDEPLARARACFEYWSAQAAEYDRKASLLKVDDPELTAWVETEYVKSDEAGGAGNFALAFGILEAALQRVESVHGEDNGLATYLLDNLGYWSLKARDRGGAARWYAESAARHLKFCGPDHPATIMARFHTAQSQRTSTPADASLAEPLRELSSAARANISPWAQEIQWIDLELSCTLADSGDSHGAFEVLMVSVTEARRYFGICSTQNEAALNLLSQLLEGFRDSSQERRRILGDLVMVQQSLFGRDDPRTLDSVRRLAALD